MTSRSLLAACAAVAVTATTCSSGDDTASDTSTSAATTTTTTEAPTTTPPPTTTAETTTTTTEPPTTEQPTTTTTEPVDEVQEVTEDFLSMWAAFDAAIRDPASDELRAALEGWLGGEMRSSIVERILEYRDAGVKARASDEHPARIEVESVTVEGDTARLVACELNSDQLVEIGAGPDGSDAVVSDSIISSRFEFQLLRASGRWIATNGVTIDEWPGELECAPV